MTPAATFRGPTISRRPLLNQLVLGVSLIGSLHFMLSLFAWVTFYFAARRNDWHHSLTIAYGARNFAPAVALMTLFTWTSIAALRRRKSALRLLLFGVVIAAAMFAVDAKGAPQFQRIWFDNPYACSNRQYFYCTWWWWQPTRH